MDLAALLASLPVARLCLKRKKARRARQDDGTPGSRREENFQASRLDVGVELATGHPSREALLEERVSRTGRNDTRWLATRRSDGEPAQGDGGAVIRHEGEVCVRR